MKLEPNEVQTLARFFAASKTNEAIGRELGTVLDVMESAGEAAPEDTLSDLIEKIFSEATKHAPVKFV